MGTYEQDSIDVRGDGRVILYKRPGLKKPKWQARIRVPNAADYDVKSTKTDDLEEAKRFALNRYEELYMHVKAGGTLKTPTFKQVYDAWKLHASTVGHTRANGSWQETFDRIESYPLEFFGQKRIDSIKEADFIEYWAWRKQNYRKKAPSLSTLSRERTAFMPVFKFALAKGYILKIPDMGLRRAKSERRPTFTETECSHLRSSVRAWVKEGKGLATWRDRFMAQHFFIVLMTSGLRVGELRGLRWCDLAYDHKQEDGSTAIYLSAYVRGKTGGRQAVFYPGTEICFRQIREQRCKELQSEHPDAVNPKPAQEEVIFCHPNGQPIQNFKNSFSALMKFAGIPIERDGKRRSIYSFRHYYATRQLSKEVSPFLLARQMGTSVEMLEEHYGQVVTRELAAQITKAQPSMYLSGEEIENLFGKL
ncbi:tyrosine-type recombinase/integrase [Caenibius sp. WL]|uniref:tyrosine-type recombinase/integrase n=1 Tax=Caenibius sp. WL TaxID=2872646 RepID=UPI001C9970D2|nr:tyrosine-type recombinase/integrase [Caenibius sp. WL]QZP08703.1 tyrosine-type recombinase/integrase [Caenibius sp. WL]